MGKSKQSRIVNNLRILRGGKCENCSYNVCFRALEFHHVNQDTKEFGVGCQDAIIDIDKMLAESNKCVLLCANCHREAHAGILNLSSFVLFEFMVEDYFSLFPVEIDLPIFKPRRPRNSLPTKYSCPNCQKFTKRATLCKNCSAKETGARRSALISWPANDILKNLVWQKTLTQIGKDLGVSMTCVLKKCKKENISTPASGYWTGKLNKT